MYVYMAKNNNNIYNMENLKPVGTCTQLKSPSKKMLKGVTQGWCLDDMLVIVSYQSPVFYFFIL